MNIKYIPCLVALICLWACGESPQETSSPPSPKPHIISIAPSLTEIVFAINGERHLVGVSDYCSYPIAAKSIESIGGINLNLEKILLLKPDFIIADKTLNNKHIPFLRKQGLTVKVFDSENVQSIIKTVRELGVLLKRSKQAEAIASDLDSLVQSIQQEVAADRNPRPTVLYELFDDPVYTAGPQSHIADAVALCGGQIAAKDLPSMWGVISLETYYTIDPDIILIAHDHVKRIQQRPGWSMLKAVKNNQVHVIKKNLYSRKSIRFVRNLRELRNLIAKGKRK